MVSVTARKMTMNDVHLRKIGITVDGRSFAFVLVTFWGPYTDAFNAINGDCSFVVIIFSKLFLTIIVFIHNTSVFFVTVFDAVELRDGFIGDVLVSVGKIKVFAVLVFFLGINLCPFAVDFLMRIHIYFIHQFVLIFDAQDQLVGRQVGIAVDDGSVGIIAISPDKGRTSGQQGGAENNKQIEEIFFCINNLRCKMFDFVKFIFANNGCIFSSFVTFGKHLLLSAA